MSPLPRLLLALSLGYLILLILGASPEGEKLRSLFEVPRPKERHGTTRTLSCLSIGLLRLSLEPFRASAEREIIRTLTLLRAGIGAAFLFHGSS